MITELEIEGFKSFGFPGEKFELGPLNFLVGSNASGKSNLIAALIFTHNAAIFNVEYAINEYGGINEIRNKCLSIGNRTNIMRISLKIDYPPEEHQRIEEKITNFEYNFAIDCEKDDAIPIVVQENLIVVTLNNGEKKRIPIIERTIDRLIVNDPFVNENNEIALHKHNYSHLVAFGAGVFSPPCAMLRDYINKWAFFNINPSLARQSSRDIPNQILGYSGDNLATILHRIESDPEIKNAILYGLKGVIPGFEDFSTTKIPVEGTWAFQILENKIEEGLNPSSISDGTVRLLSLLVISVWVAKRSPFITIEEPENGLHPHLAGHLVDIFRDASENAQFLITTHNPDFLDYLKPDEVMLCDKVDGLTKIKKATDIVDIETFRKDFTLGELWEQGALGGTP